MTEQKAKQKVFISHSHEDPEWARDFAQALRDRGIEVWFDEFAILPGESIRDAIESGLRESDTIVALIDPDALNRPALFFELGAAIGLGKKVIAVVPKDFDPSKLPQSLRLRRYLFRDSPERTANELVSAAS